MIAKTEQELFDLARLALASNGESADLARRNVEAYVHRLAWRYRDTPLGEKLSEIDKVPPVSLRKLVPYSITAETDDTHGWGPRRNSPQ